CMYMIWGAVCTFPHIERFGLDALRDGVLWSWGLVGLVVGYLVASRNLFFSVTAWYAKWFRRFVYWAPLAVIVFRTMADGLPRLPWGPEGGVLILNPKGGDIAVHLAGALAFGLLVARHPHREGGRAEFRTGWPFWVSWLMAFT